MENPKTSKRPVGGENRGGKVGRAISVMRHLRIVGATTLNGLMELFGGGERTMQRLLALIRDLGEPLEETIDDEGRKHYSLNYRGEEKKAAGLFRTEHYVTQRLGMEQGDVLRSSSTYYAFSEDTADKMAGLMGTQVQGKLARLEKVIYSSDAGVYEGVRPDFLGRYLDAAVDNRICSVTYRAPRPDAKNTLLRILPLRLFVRHGEGYLLYWSLPHQDYGKLKLIRTQRLQVLNGTMPDPKGFDPKVLLSDFSLHRGPKTRFHLRFSRDAAPYIQEKPLREWETRVERPDGGVDVFMEVSDTVEVLAWICSSRDACEVMEPRPWRHTLYHLHKKMMERYADCA